MVVVFVDHVLVVVEVKNLMEFVVYVFFHD
jgi:hypothetical protein